MAHARSTWLKISANSPTRSRTFLPFIKTRSTALYTLLWVRILFLCSSGRLPRAEWQSQRQKGLPLGHSRRSARCAWHQVSRCTGIFHHLLPSGHFTHNPALLRRSIFAIYFFLGSHNFGRPPHRHRRGPANSTSTSLPCPLILSSKSNLELGVSNWIKSLFPLPRRTSAHRRPIPLPNALQVSRLPLIAPARARQRLRCQTPFASFGACWMWTRHQNWDLGTQCRSMSCIRARWTRPNLTRMAAARITPRWPPRLRWKQ